MMTQQDIRELISKSAQQAALANTRRARAVREGATALAVRFAQEQREHEEKVAALRKFVQ
jgi:hypothetical protein